MYKYEISGRIEGFAPLETQEDWDCSGWVVDSEGNDEIKSVMLCLTVTDDVVCQAREMGCEMIVSHHPCFVVPLGWSGVNIYSAHTNLDKADGGTTDLLVEKFGLSGFLSDFKHDFLRFVDIEIGVEEFSRKVVKLFPGARFVEKEHGEKFRRIAFCAGSGVEFVNFAYEHGADCLVTGDVKFHAAVESPICVYDVGHYESEVGGLSVFEGLLGSDVEVIYAREKSPFRNIDNKF